LFEESIIVVVFLLLWVYVYVLYLCLESVALKIAGMLGRVKCVRVRTRTVQEEDNNLLCLVYAGL